MKETDKPYFSIIVPVYNVEKYLKRCVDSIISQNFADFELILIDDGSTDKSSEICDELEKKEDRIKVVHKSNEGLGITRNVGIDVAEGKYILFVDSDDYVMPNLLKAVYEKMEQYSPEIVFYGLKRIERNGKNCFNLIPNTSKIVYDNKEEIKNEILAECISNTNNTGLTVSACNFCINNEFLKNNNLKFVSEREYISEDLFFYIEMFKNLSKICFLNEPYYCYWQNQGSLTTSYRKDRFKNLKSFYKEMQKKAIQYNYSKKIVQRLYGAFLSNVMGCLKMELANRDNTNIKQAFEKAEKIYKDDFLQEAVNSYDGTNKSKGWRLFYYCIKNRKYNLLSVALLIKYKLRGI